MIPRAEMSATTALLTVVVWFVPGCTSIHSRTTHTQTDLYLHARLCRCQGPTDPLLYYHIDRWTDRWFSLIQGEQHTETNKHKYLALHCAAYSDGSLRCWQN